MVCENNCDTKCDDEKIATDIVPTAAIIELIDVSGLTAILSAIATTGIKNLSFKDVGLEKLARKVSALAAENSYLKKLAAILSPVQAEASVDEVCIRFGPANSYTLTLLITDDNKQELAQQLQTIAANLTEQHKTKTEKNPAAQLTLFREHV